MMAWWLQNNLRMIQNNLRDTDAAMDVDKLIKELKEFHCNTVMVGAGGITSFYPTKLAYQWPSPFLNGRDLLGEVLEKCHKENIRVIGRFDFSKTHESFYAEHPEWYYQSAKGQNVCYNDTVHTCINGWYQQTYSLQIISEVLSLYPLDGIFFNMFGFVTHDYSNNYYGICHCEACKKRFRAFSGMELPAKESKDDPAYAKYLEFKEYVVGDILKKVHELTRSFGPEIAVCTYHHKYVDIIRNESNSAVDRPYPFWLYNSSCNVAKVRSNWDDKIISNCVINAADIFYRFVGVSKELTRIRLYENIAEGSGLDYCIIGVFEDYPDRENFEYAKEVFAFHQKNEKYFSKLKSAAKTAVIQPIGITPVTGGNKNFLGIFKALKEEHIPFDVLGAEKIMACPDVLKQYELAVFPDLTHINAEVVKAVREQGVFAIFSGVTSPLDENLKNDFEFQISETRTQTRAAYLHTKPKGIFTHFEKRDWVILDRDFGVADAPAYQKLLPIVHAARFGPPERCFGHEEGGSGGVWLSNTQHCAFVTWNLGELYYQYGYEDHKYILTDLIDAVAPQVRVYQTNAPSCVEIFWNKTGDGEYMLQLLNLSGFNGTTVTAHLPVHNITVDIPLNGVKEMISLMGSAVSFAEKDKMVQIKIDCLEQYASYVIR